MVEMGRYMRYGKYGMTKIDNRVDLGVARAWNRRGYCKHDDYVRKEM